MFKVMHIDDQELPRRNVRFTLEESGEFQVEGYSTVLQSLTALRERRFTPDLILLDYLMPGEDPFEIIAEVEGNASLKGVKIVWFTASKRGTTHAELAEKGGILANHHAIIKGDLVGDRFVAAILRFLKPDRGQALPDEYRGR